MKMRISSTCLPVIALLLLALPGAAAGNLLIQGATLIDGTGKPPIVDARILIEGNVIRRVDSKNKSAPSRPFH